MSNVTIGKVLTWLGIAALVVGAFLIWIIGSAKERQQDCRDASNRAVQYPLEPEASILSEDWCIEMLVDEMTRPPGG